MSEDVVSVVEGGEHNPEYRALVWHCVGCGETHICQIEGVKEHARWTWDGSLTAPTLLPSVLKRSGRRVCHSFVEKGVVRFLPDCSHDIAGLRVRMLPQDARPFDEKLTRPLPPMPVG